MVASKRVGIVTCTHSQRVVLARVDPAQMRVQIVLGFQAAEDDHRLTNARIRRPVGDAALDAEMQTEHRTRFPLPQPHALRELLRQRCLADEVLEGLLRVERRDDGARVEPPPTGHLDADGGAVLDDDAGRGALIEHGAAMAQEGSIDR